MARNIIAGIDVGSHSIKVVVVEYQGKKELPRLLSLTRAESQGIKQGYVEDMQDVQEAIRHAISASEKNCGQRIKRAFVSIGDITLDSELIDGSAVVSRGDSEISEHDIQRAVETAEYKVSDAPNRTILEVIQIVFKLDSKKVLTGPKGMKGQKLEVRSLFVSSLKQHAQDLKRAIEQSGIAVEDMIAYPLASHLVTITKPQRQAGCILVDIGHDTTKIGVFEDGVLNSCKAFPFGSQNITKDIALRFKISLEEAEQIKIKGERPSAQSSADKKKLQAVIEARLTDIFEHVQNHLKKLNRNELLPAGVVLTGGGSKTAGIEEFTKEYLKLPVRKATPLFPQTYNLKLGEKATERYQVDDPSFSIAYGLAILGLNPDYKEESMGIRINRRAKSSMIRFIRQFLP